MNDALYQFLTSQIKPTVLPLYTEVIEYLTELNVMEESSEIDELIDSTLSDEINNPTEALDSILYTQLSTIASTYGIVLDHNATTLRNLFTILKALDSLEDLIESDKMYITDILDSDISGVYKLTNILELLTTLDNVTISEMINDVTDTLLENIRTIVKVDVEDNDLIPSSKILTFLVNISNKYTTIGARVYNETNYLDNSIRDLIRIYWDEVNHMFLGEEVYSLLILGRDSRFRVVDKFIEVFEGVIDESSIESVTDKVKELDKRYSSKVKEIFSIEDEIEE